jgi:glycosyltransferase involved in cell wall biosynthesis
MKVLMIHNRYRERGGEDYCFEAELNLLRSAGIECQFHQVDNRDKKSFGAPAAINAVWSQRAAHEVSRMVQDHQIDLVHIHNFFPQLSPSIHWAAYRARAAVVQSLHNYRLACVNGQFFRDGRICEDCLGRSPVRGIVHRCYRNGLAASSTVATMLVTHRAIGTWVRRVNRFIAMSGFARTKMIEAGLPAAKIDVKPNFLEFTPPAPGPGDGGYFVYVGRLSSEKGIRTLIEAWKSLPAPVPALKIIGSGPLDEFAKSAAATIPQITMLGGRSPAEVLEVVGCAEALIFPSEWYETFGRVLIEAYAMGTPVIASDIGAVPEIVKEGVTGLKFRAGSAADLVKKIRQFLGDPARKIAMRFAAREEFLSHYTASDNIKLLRDVYERALENSKKVRQVG